MRAENLRLEKEAAALEIAHAQSSADFAVAGVCFLEFATGQKDYLRSRRIIARKAHSKLAVIGAIVVAIAAAGTVLGGIDSPWVLACIGLIGVAAPAISAAVKSWSEATVEKERAALHKATGDQLADLLGEAQRFSDAVTSNDLDAAMVYVAQVFDILRQDHKGFADLHG